MMTSKLNKPLAVHLKNLARRTIRIIELLEEGKKDGPILRQIKQEMSDYAASRALIHYYRRKLR